MDQAGNFTLRNTSIQDLLLIETKNYNDGRGFFMETWNEQNFEALGLTAKFVQDNRSRSKHGTLRGLHFQKTRPQGKLVWVTNGEVFDVAVDLRKSSPSFGRWYAVTLRGDEGTLFYIPPGFAHGFYVVSDHADFMYKCTDFYVPGDEGGLLWNDPSLGIEWPTSTEPILADKDKLHPTLDRCFTYP